MFDLWHLDYHVVTAQSPDEGITQLSVRHHQCPGATEGRDAEWKQRVDITSAGSKAYIHKPCSGMVVIAVAE